MTEENKIPDEEQANNTPEKSRTEIESGTAAEKSAVQQQPQDGKEGDPKIILGHLEKEHAEDQAAETDTSLQEPPASEETEKVVPEEEEASEESPAGDVTETVTLQETSEETSVAPEPEAAASEEASEETPAGGESEAITLQDSAEETPAAPEPEAAASKEASEEIPAEEETETLTLTDTFEGTPADQETTDIVDQGQGDSSIPSDQEERPSEEGIVQIDEEPSSLETPQGDETQELITETMKKLDNLIDKINKEIEFTESSE